MLLIKKAYCRTFQTGLRAALPILPYREPEMYSSISDLALIIKKENIRALLIVTDRGIVKNGLTEALENLLRNLNIRYHIYDGTQANPTVKNVEEARLLYKKHQLEAIIAIGGGSAIDCAKAVGARLAYPKKKVGEMKGILRVLKKIPTLIAIPTTAGTGSEVTLAAVITEKDKSLKYALMSFPLIPRYAILDPALTYSLPPHLTSTTGMDALTHAVEAYIGRSTTKETRKLALEATKLIFENIETAYQYGHNHEARANMLKAAYKAGLAFSKSYVGYIHAIAHSLGGRYGTPHGLANAIIMPYVLEAYGMSAHKKLHQLAIAAGLAKVGDNEAQAAKKFIEAIKKLNANMHIPNKIGDIKRRDISIMARRAEKEANPLYPVPKLMTQKELERLYYLIADWSK